MVACTNNSSVFLTAPVLGDAVIPPAFFQDRSAICAHSTGANGGAAEHETPRHRAAAGNDDTATVAAPLDACAGVNARAGRTRTARLNGAAMENRNAAVVMALSDAGADPVPP